MIITVRKPIAWRQTLINDQPVPTPAVPAGGYDGFQFLVNYSFSHSIVETFDYANYIFDDALYDLVKVVTSSTVTQATYVSSQTIMWLELAIPLPARVEQFSYPYNIVGGIVDLHNETYAWQLHPKDIPISLVDAYIDPLKKDYQSVANSLRRDPANGLANAIYMRIVCPLGSYWADAQFGSRLYELVREKDVPRVEVLAIQYCEQALKPLLDDGRARQIDVSAQKPSMGRLNLLVDVIAASGDRHLFIHPVKVL